MFCVSCERRVMTDEEYFKEFGNISTTTQEKLPIDDSESKITETQSRINGLPCDPSLKSERMIDCAQPRQDLIYAYAVICQVSQHQVSSFFFFLFFLFISST